MKKFLCLALALLAVSALAGCNTGTAPAGPPTATDDPNKVRQYLTTRYPNDVFPYDVNPTTNNNGWAGTGTGNNVGVNETGVG